MIKGSLICSTSLYEKIKETSNESDTREASIICEYFFPFFCTIYIFTLSLLIKVDLMIKVEEASTLVKV